jgi:beta-glucosidase
MLDYDLTHGRTYLYSRLKPLYPFGFGLTYTTFHYDRIATSAPAIPADGQLTVTATVSNTGSRDSDEVVQLYVRHDASQVARPQLQLIGFARIPVPAGKSVDVTLPLKARDLAYWDPIRHAWRVEKEPITLLTGGSSDNLPVTTQIQITSTAEFKP